jgi:teichuronic acid exporter
MAILKTEPTAPPTNAAAGDPDALVPSADAVAEARKLTPSDSGSTVAATANHNQAIASGVMWQGALRWLSQVLSWTATIVIARKLSAEDYGIAGTATVLVGLLSLVTDMGLGRTLVMRREKDPQIIAQAHGAAILTGLMAGALMLLVAIPLSWFYREPRVAPVIAVLCLALIFSGMNAVPLALLQQQLQYRRLAAIDFGKTILQATVVLIGSIVGLRYWSLVLGLIVGNAMAVVLTRRFVAVKPQRPNVAVLTPTITYTRHLVLSSVAWYLYSNADFATVGRVSGLAALGYYQFAWNVAQLPGEKLANVMQAVVGPFFGSIGADKVALRHYFLVLSELLVSIMLPVLCGFALVSPIAVPIIFGSKWIAAIPILQFLVVSAALSSFALLSQHVLGATGRAEIATRLNLSALVVLPILFYIAAKTVGPVAVAFVWLIAQPVLIGVPLMRLREVISLSLGEYLRNLKAPVVSALLMSGAVWLTRDLTTAVAPILQLCLAVSVGIVVYASAYLLIFRDRVRAIVSLWHDRT